MINYLNDAVMKVYRVEKKTANQFDSPVVRDQPVPAFRRQQPLNSGVLKFLTL